MGLSTTGEGSTMNKIRLVIVAIMLALVLVCKNGDGCTLRCTRECKQAASAEYCVEYCANFCRP